MEDWMVRNRGEHFFGGAWQVEEVVGRGTYAAVYRARHAKTGEIAAIKEIELGGMRDLLKYKAELHFMECLKDAGHVVKIRESMTEEGRACIRMDLLTSLPRVLRGRRMTDPLVCKVGMDLCDALSDCEAAGIIHRDVKPANVLVTEEGECMLADFGEAIFAKEAGRAKREMAGTLSYMAPEVYYEKAYDFRVDLYSLGLLLYQLANGNVAPFLCQETNVLVPEDMRSAIHSRMTGRVMAPPAGCGQELSQVILKAAAYDPADRFGSAREMGEALKRIYDRRSI